MIDSLIKLDRLQGWIFDLDGVITDTAVFHYQAWKKLADEEGLLFNEGINEKLRGVSRMASLEIILDGKVLSVEEKTGMTDRKNGYYKDLLNNLSSESILPGVIPLLKELKRNNRSIAIGSASRNTDYIVDKLDIRHYFDGISCGVDVIRAKPAPDVFLHAAGRLGLSVHNCIVIEDAEAGVTAAVTSGFSSIGIGPKERVGHADYRFDSTEDLKPGLA